MHTHTQVDDKTDDRLVVAGSSCTDACTTMISFDGSVRKTNFFKDGEKERTEQLQQQQQHRAEDEATKNFHGNEGGLKAAVLVAKRLKRLPHAAGEAQSEEEECRPDRPRIINESKDYSGQERPSLAIVEQSLVLAGRVQHDGKTRTSRPETPPSTTPTPGSTSCG